MQNIKDVYLFYSMVQFFICYVCVVFFVVLYLCNCFGLYKLEYFGFFIFLVQKSWVKGGIFQ